MSSRGPTSAVSLGLASLTAAVLAALGLAVHEVGEAMAAERAAWPRTEERVLVPPPRVGRLLAIGYNELAADLAWSRLLVYYGSGLGKQSGLRDVEPLLELVNALDPFFRRPYRWGAYATTYRTGPANQEEFRASIRVLERGVRAFPDDWELFWVLGLRHAYDLQSEDPAERRRWREQGADYMEKAMHMPEAPPDLPLDAASMRTRLGQTDRALRELGEMILSATDDATRAKLAERYQAIAGSQPAGNQLRRAGQELFARWQADLPYVPTALWVLVGAPAPRAFDMRAILESQDRSLSVEEVDPPDPAPAR